MTDGMQDKPAFYFLVVFWGETHRKYFEKFCLSSLLADGNIPSLENKKDSKFLICTTPKDWQDLQESPLFQKMQEHIEAEWLEMPMPDAAENKMRVMSRGHARLTQRAFEDQVYAINVNPDTIFTDTVMTEMARHAADGRKLVFHCAIRFEMEGVIAELEAEGLMREGKPMALPARTAIDIGLRNPHSELKACNFNSAAYWDFPVHTYMEVPGEHGIIIHNLSWAAVLVDYSVVEVHDTQTFEDWTLDGDYIYNNFKNLDVDRDVYVARDSDEFFLLSVTEKDQATVPDTPSGLKSLPIIGEWFRGDLLNVAFTDDRIDPMKKIIFLDPVYLHSRDLTPKWRRVEARLARVLAANLSPVNETWAGISVRDRVNAKRRYAMELTGKSVWTQRWIVFSWWSQKIMHMIVSKLVFYEYRLLRHYLGRVVDYTRVTFLAICGDKVEQQRIAKRFKWLWLKVREWGSPVKSLVLNTVRRIARLVGAEDRLERTLSKLWERRHAAEALAARDAQIADLRNANESLEREFKTLTAEHERLKASSEIDKRLAASIGAETAESAHVELKKLTGEIVSTFDDAAHFNEAVQQLRRLIVPLWSVSRGIGTDGYYQSLPFHFGAGAARETFDALMAERDYLDPSRLISFMHMLEDVGRLEAGEYGEFGVRNGHSAKMIHTLMDPACRLYLFDTFAGFHVDDFAAEQENLDEAAYAAIAPTLTLKDGAETTGYTASDDLPEAVSALDVESVVKNVADARDGENIVPVPGRLPETLGALDDTRWRFAHIDLDLYGPTKSTLEWLWPRMVPGGLIAVHDCRDVTFVGARKATEEFAADAGVTPVIMADAWGTAVLAKPSNT